MSKSFQRVLLLFAIGVGFGIFAIYQMMNGPDSDHVALGAVYLIPSIAAFAALLMLPSKRTE